MSFKELLCMNGGSDCGCAGHCPYWIKPQNTEDEDLTNLLYMRGHNRNKR